MAQVSNHKSINTNSGSPSFFNLSSNAKATWKHATIKVIIQHQQEYQHQYSREKKPNSLVNIAGKLRVRITIVEDVTVVINIARISLLAASRRNNPKPIRRSKIFKTVPKKNVTFQHHY
jgi:hypothetical protein